MAAEPGYVAESSVRRVARWLLVVGLVIQGVNHFIADEFLIRMIPPWLPWPAALVYVSGIAEIVLGLLAIPSRTRRWAGWGILALLVVVFPANLQMALHPEDWPNLPAWALWARLPLQPLFMLWAWAACLRRPRRGTA
jgi:uncharacterized membrane protein